MPRPRTPKGRARETFDRLIVEYPDAHCELDHRNPYELLAATILSAQCTDVRVNMVTPALFARYPTPEDLAVARPDDVEELVRSTGFYKNKTKSLIGMAQALVERYGGEVPSSMKDLVSVPSVARRPTWCAASPWTCRVCRSTPMSGDSRCGWRSPPRPIRSRWSTCSTRWSLRRSGGSSRCC
jgi:hypothetical protein